VVCPYQVGKPLPPESILSQSGGVGVGRRAHRPLLGIGNVPRMLECVRRYIPEDDLARMMTAVRALKCPYQRTALLIARWSGARRNEIRHLPVDCLDRYPDGTARLRIPPGKFRRERVVPLNEEAAKAV
jgi:integrase